MNHRDRDYGCMAGVIIISGLLVLLAVGGFFAHRYEAYQKAVQAATKPRQVAE